MDALWPQLARGALREPAQGEFAHRESCGKRVALDAGARAGQQDGAMALRDHTPGGLLDDQKATKGRYFHGLPHRLRIDLSDWAGCPRAGVVEDDIGRSKPRLCIL